MKQGGIRTVDGFTIVETLIVLAVTGILAISALLLINGRQNNTEFQTSINDLKQQLQQVINQTETGYYPNQANFSCTSTGGSRPAITTLTPTGQGQNGDCILLGNVLYFGQGGQTTNQFTVLPIAGARLASTGLPVSTVAASWPTALSKGAATNLLAPDNNYTLTKMEGGLTFVGANTDTTAAPYAFAVLSSVSSGAASNQSGSQQFRLFGFTNSFGVPTSTRDVVDKINGATTSPATTAITELTGGTQLRIASGSTNQCGLLTISDGLSVSLEIKANTTCR